MHLYYTFKLLSSSPQSSGAYQRPYLLNLDVILSAGLDIAGDNLWACLPCSHTAACGFIHASKTDHPPATLRRYEKQTY